MRYKFLTLPWRLAAAALLGGLVTTGASGCNTIEGIGKDISGVARETRKAIERR